MSVTQINRFEITIYGVAYEVTQKSHTAEYTSADVTRAVAKAVRDAWVDDVITSEDVNGGPIYADVYTLGDVEEHVGEFIVTGVCNLNITDVKWNLENN